MGQENDIINSRTTCGHNRWGRSRGRRVFRGKGIPNKSKPLSGFLFSLSSLLVSCLNTTTPCLRRQRFFTKLLSCQPYPWQITSEMHPVKYRFGRGTSANGHTNSRLGSSAIFSFNNNRPTNSVSVENIPDHGE